MLCTSYAVDWPLPPDPDARIVPGWAAAEDEARHLQMPLPAYLDWAATAEGQRWLERLRIKWAIRAEAERREAAERAAGHDDAAWQARGWRGGRCDPHEFSIFADEAA